MFSSLSLQVPPMCNTDIYPVQGHNSRVKSTGRTDGICEDTISIKLTLMGYEYIEYNLIHHTHHVTNLEHPIDDHKTRFMRYDRHQRKSIKVVGR